MRRHTVQLLIQERPSCQLGYLGGGDEGGCDVCSERIGRDRFWDWWVAVHSRRNQYLVCELTVHVGSRRSLRVALAKTATLVGNATGLRLGTSMVENLSEE